MATKKYHGSCHCGKIKFTANIDFSKGTGRCNCTFCTKARWWGAVVKPQDFTLLEGKEALSDYTKAAPLTFTTDFAKGESLTPYTTHQLFCKHCGIRPFGMGHVPEIGGDYVSVNVAALDDIDFKEVMAAPMQYFDGRHDNWMQKPEMTAHL